MDFIYDYARLPDDEELLNHVSLAAKRLYSKLQNMDVCSLNISDYNKKYFGQILSALLPNLYFYAYVLVWILKDNINFMDRLTLLDYGGGSGVLSLMAREAGLGIVIYNDIYDVSCRDAEVIGRTLGLKADYYVHGDTDDVIRFVKENNLHCDIVASRDVIEHVYDEKVFLRKIASLSDGTFTIVMSTTANGFNPYMKRKFVKMHREVEYKDREPEWGHKERDCLKSYFSVRKEMSVRYAKELSYELSLAEAEMLARNTRGLIEKDIRNCVHDYVRTKKLTNVPSHPTNTCDPYTGNWAEHLMDPFELADVLEQEGFAAQVLGGYYRPSAHPLKQAAGVFLNKIISAFPVQGLRVSPFYTIYARKD